MDMILLNLGYLLVLLALAIREILWLRITLTIAQSALFSYSTLNHNYNITIWNHYILDKLRKSKPNIMGKLDRILTLDIAGKLTR